MENGDLNEGLGRSRQQIKVAGLQEKLELVCERKRKWQSNRNQPGHSQEHKSVRNFPCHLKKKKKNAAKPQSEINKTSTFASQFVLIFIFHTYLSHQTCVF